MKKINSSIVAAVIAISTLTMLSPHMASAQTAGSGVEESITLSPVGRKYKVDAGQTIEDSLTIINDGKVAYDFIIYSRPYSMPAGASSYDSPSYTATPANADAYSWVQTPKAKYHLEGGASTTVKYTIRVPERAAPGGHYGVIFAETQPAESQQAPNSVFRKKRVGSIIYATVNGQYITEGQVESATIPFWQFQPPLHAESLVKNSGNADFTNDIVFTVKDLFGNTKYQQSKQSTILPQTSRKLSYDWTDASWFGFYKVELSQTVLGKQSTNSGYVLILPKYIPILLLALLVLAGAYGWLRRGKKRGGKK